jgi:hypothetical protein
VHLYFDDSDLSGETTETPWKTNIHILLVLKNVHEHLSVSLCMCDLVLCVLPPHHTWLVVVLPQTCSFLPNLEKIVCSLRWHQHLGFFSPYLAPNCKCLVTLPCHRDDGCRVYLGRELTETRFVSSATPNLGLWLRSQAEQAY